ncbi:MAG TPA: hypothetical protein VMI33_06925, partial [Streptosporangiaceae bacterium]|nr:hypothetical protein [Streptosporangiaceae bacterium]
MTGHRFDRPPLVRPDLPPFDACLQCGRPEAEHEQPPAQPGQFAAVVAEVGMLRERAARGRRRATPDQGRPRRVSPVTQWADAGYEQAMQSVLETARETARFGTVATLRAVVDL